MSKDKYQSLFSPNRGYCVLLSFQIFFAARAVLKIGGYSWIFPSFSWGTFGPHDVFGPIARKQKDLMDYKNKIYIGHDLL